MVLLTIIIQFFILIKNAIVAFYFGVSAELDAFNLANRISTFIYSFIGAGISTVIIPYLKDRINKKAIDVFISVVYTVSLILLVIMIFFRENIMIIAGGSNDNYFISLAANLFIFTTLTGFVNSLIQLVKAILEFKDRFNIQKIIVLLTTILLVIMLWTGDNNIYYYALVLLFTALISVLIHVLLLKKSSFKYSLSYDMKDQNFKEMMRLFFPTLLSTGVYQIALLIDTLIAARLPTGSISILNYSNTVISMINLLLLGNITSFVYPKLVKKINNQERQRSLVDYLLLVNIIMCLIIILFYSSGLEAISILFERGEFTSDNTFIVFIIALILTISLPTNASRDLLYRYFYMNKDTFTPFMNSIMISVINIVISLVLSIYIGLYGVVIGTVLASYISLFFISFRFKRKFPLYFNLKGFLFENGKIIIITILSLIASTIFKKTIIIENNYFGLITYALFSLTIFILLLKVLRSRIFKINL